MLPDRNQPGHFQRRLAGWMPWYTRTVTGRRPSRAHRGLSGCMCREPAPAKLRLLCLLRSELGSPYNGALPCVILVCQGSNCLGASAEVLNSILHLWRRRTKRESTNRSRHWCHPDSSQVALGRFTCIHDVLRKVLTLAWPFCVIQKLSPDLSEQRPIQDHRLTICQEKGY